ncbi:MAG: FimV/HubP family polar landmark protein [Pseudomonadota bacterium]|nr:FimV/HubP family polar landmark protein [Pseudomonadota bacterium]
MKNTSQQLGRFALTSVAVAALSLGTVADAWALGLGRLAVQSALGETLRAEIDVTSLTPEEAGNLKIRIATPETYRASGVDYNSVLPTTQAALLKRADGRPFLRLTSDRVVQEPFVDVILELSWSTGRLVREYTLLFDPPSERTQAAAPTPAPAVATAPVFSAPAAAPSPAPRAPRAVASAPVATPPAPERAAKPVMATRAPSEPVGDSYRVRTGDTLTRIASLTRRGGVSLDQTLVSLYRGNPQAFIGENMNRLKAGVLLTVPTAEAAAAVEASEARQLIQVQSADFGSFRQRLAAAAPAVQADAPARKDAGKVQANVDDRKATAPVTPDKLTLSKGASAAKPGASEVKISKDKEKQDTAVRVAELSKNVEELKKLSGATSVATAAATPAVPAPVPQAASVPASKTEPAAASAPNQAAPAAAPKQEAKPVVNAPVAASAPVHGPTAAPASDNGPGFFSGLLESNPLLLGLGGGAVLALLGFGAYRARRAKLDTGETSFLESRLQPDSFFGASGGQRIDTREAASGAPSSMSYSLSQLDAIGDVDPVAEADVYLAYGRDLQAEEILKEAMRGSPDRMAIRTKLLEVYAKRRDTKGFELLATQLFALTGGTGEDWEKAQDLGLDIDPDNPLYQPGGSPDSVPAGDSGLMSEPLGASTMPQSVLPTQSHFGDVPTEVLGNNTSEEVDFDLDLDAMSSEPPAVQPSLESFDFVPAPTPAAPQAFYPAAVEASAPVSVAKSPLEFDMSAISLDLDAPVASSATDIDIAMDGVVDDDIDDDNADPLARKFELAEEFRQIGDTEGARDLLQEVASKAEGALKAKAQSMLDDLD